MTFGGYIKRVLKEIVPTYVGDFHSSSSIAGRGKWRSFTDMPLGPLIPARS